MHSIPLSLYIHFPWCVQKCPYCDFNSHRQIGSIPTSYTTALCHDLKTHMPINRPIETIFLGGGTPSLYPTKELAKLLAHIKAHYPIAPQAEITLEANPGTIEHGQFIEYRKMGITRISLGAQTFCPDTLKMLGRIHRSQDIPNAVEAIKKAGFDNFNIDIMHGLPRQTADQAVDDLKKACQLGPTHLSWYQLTIEPNTAFWANPPTLPDEATLTAIERNGLDYLKDQHFLPYEVSAYAQSDQYQCQHNLNYWTFGDYIGIGAGAHSKLTDTTTGTITRIQKHRNPKLYLAAQHHWGQKTWSIQMPEEIAYEFLFNALRLQNGFSEMLFTQRTGLSIGHIAQPLKIGVQRGLLTWNESWICPTPFGRQFLNDCLQLFTPSTD